MSSSTVVDHMRENFTHEQHELKVGFAYLYCSYNDQKSQTLDALLRSVIRQLISSFPASSQMSDSLLQLAVLFHQKFAERSPEVRDYTDLLEDVVSKFDRVFVMIDALDECAEVDHTGSNNRAELISVLSGLSIHLLVTSRQLGNIRDLMSASLEIPIRPDQQDIQSYIKWRISDPKFGSKKLRQLAQTHKGLEDEIIDVVCQKYSPVYVQHVRSSASLLTISVSISFDFRWII